MNKNETPKSSNASQIEQNQQQQYQQYYYQNYYPYSYLPPPPPAPPPAQNPTLAAASAQWYQQQQQQQQQQQNYFNYYQNYQQQYQQQPQRYPQPYFNNYNRPHQPRHQNWHHQQNYSKGPQQQQQNQQHRFQHNNNENKRQKPNKRDLPDNNKYFCEACDRGFKTEDKHKEHLETHKICGKNGCKFEAADKLVQIHIRNFHASGLDKKVNRAENEEEMKKYIEERKKHFPTKDNLEKKVEVDKDMSERGEILTTKEFRKDSRFGQNNKRKKPNKRLSNKRSRFNNSDGNETGKTVTGNEENKENTKQQRQVNTNKPKKPTLLERLLAPDIRHERNLLLQSIRYIVNKNFFMK